MLNFRNLRFTLQTVRSRSRLCIIATTVLIWALLFVLFNVFADDKRYLEINAETESLTFKVVRPEFSAFPVVGATIRNQPHCESILAHYDAQDFVGIVRPAAGSTVKYRISSDQVSVRVEADEQAAAASDQTTGSAGDLIMAGAMCALGDSATIMFSRTHEQNKRPLPIAGPVEIGSAFGPPLAPERGRRANEGFMYGADVYVFGRSLWSDRLFPLYDGAISIPAGGTLSTVEFNASASSEKQSFDDSTAWYGIAELGERAFLVSATVQTTDLVFTRAGSSGEQETIAVSFFTEVVRDPDLSAFLLWLGLLFFLFQVVVTLFSILQNGRDE